MPAATVIFGLALALVTLGAFVALVQRAFESTQIGGILRTLMRRGYAVIEDVHPRDAPIDDVPAPPPARDDAVELAHPGPPAVIAAVDRAALLRLARADRRLRRGRARWSGEYLAPGTVVLRVSGGARDPDPALARRVFVLARQRTVDQDPAFALRMLVDIAIRGAVARGQRSRRPRCRRSTGSRRCSSTSPHATRARRSWSTPAERRARSSPPPGGRTTSSWG